VVTLLEVEGIQTWTDHRALQSPAGGNQQHYISRMLGSLSTTCALETTDLEESQGGIPVIDPNKDRRSVISRPETVGGEVQYLVEWETTWDARI